jgi:hypothetical protein
MTGVKYECLECGAIAQAIKDSEDEARDAAFKKLVHKDSCKYE